MEVVLDFVMAYLEFLTSKLEATAHPILDSIVHKARMLDKSRVSSSLGCAPQHACHVTQYHSLRNGV